MIVEPRWHQVMARFARKNSLLLCPSWTSLDLLSFSCELPSPLMNTTLAAVW